MLQTTEGCCIMSTIGHRENGTCQVTDPVFLPCRPVRRATSPPVQFDKSTSPPVLCNMGINDSNRYILIYIVKVRLVWLVWWTGAMDLPVWSAWSRYPRGQPCLEKPLTVGETTEVQIGPTDLVLLFLESHKSQN
jgi:hypothetical protein